MTGLHDRSAHPCPFMRGRERVRVTQRQPRDDKLMRTRVSSPLPPSRINDPTGPTPTGPGLSSSPQRRRPSSAFSDRGPTCLESVDLFHSRPRRARSPATPTRPDLQGDEARKCPRTSSEDPGARTPFRPAPLTEGGWGRKVRADGPADRGGPPAALRYGFEITQTSLSVGGWRTHGRLSPLLRRR